MQTNDLYEQITNKIIQDLEKGELTWRKPWSDKHLNGHVMLPLRSNGIPYSGINTIMLWIKASEQNFQSPYWFTFKQGKELNATVRKGEKGTQVVYTETYEKESKHDKEKTEKISFLKVYTVFNAGQFEGLPERYFELPERETLNPEKRDETIDAFIEATRAKIKTGFKAAYFIGNDHIEMPPFESFETATGYYSTLAHELTHWTRHPTRLNRDFERVRWGDEGYAKEELVAELGACFLAAELGFAPKSMEQHAAYIQSWLSVLKNDKKFIFQAARHAQLAVQYMMQLSNPKTENLQVLNL